MIKLELSYNYRYLKWTNSAVDCWQIQSDCLRCAIAKIMKNHGCCMAAVVAKALKKYGPPETAVDRLIKKPLNVKNAIKSELSRKCLEEC